MNNLIYKKTIEKLLMTKFNSITTLRAALYLINYDEEFLNGKPINDLSLTVISKDLNVTKTRVSCGMAELEKHNIIKVSNNGMRKVYKFVV